MDKRELVDAGCFISQMNELLMIDPMYINYSITHYFNNFINDKKELLPTQGLNGIYFPNAKVGLWSSIAIREKSYDQLMSSENPYGYDHYSCVEKNENPIVLSMVCFNNTDWLHEFLTIEKIEELEWEVYKPNTNTIPTKQDATEIDKDQTEQDDKLTDNKKLSSNSRNKQERQKEKGIEQDSINKTVIFSDYFTNVLTTESGQIGLFCVESIKNCASTILKNTVNNEITKKDQLDKIFEKNLVHLEPWYNKICDLTYNFSIGIIDFIDRPVGCVCSSSNTINVANYLCEIVKDELINEIWAIKVDFMNPLT